MCINGLVTVGLLNPQLGSSNPARQTVVAKLTGSVHLGFMRLTMRKCPEPVQSNWR